MNKKQFLDETIKKILDLNISSILEVYIDLVRKGDNYLAICPFHNDTKIGSFVVNNARGIFKCFSCDEGGNAIHFVSKLKGINYVEAVLTIAYDFSLITDGEYKKYSSGREYSNDGKSNSKKTYQTQVRHEDAVLDIDVRDKVYNLLLDELTLSDEHYNYLRTIRDLSTDVIEERRYKTYPSASIINNLIRAMNSCDMDVDKVLSQTAGFFQKKIDGRWLWRLPYNKGILIPARDYKGRIEGLQIRRDFDDEDKGRYIWLSSTFANNKENFKFGTSSKSPIDVIYPKGCNPNIKTDVISPSRVLFITEGRFKSEIITSKFKSTCISIQGVSNWREIDKLINNTENLLIEKNTGFKGFKHIYIAFDSDMKYKYPVYNQLRNMSDYIISKIESADIYYLHWESEDKGIDDLLINYQCANNFNYRELFNKIDKMHWDKEYSKQVTSILKIKGLDNPMLLDSDDLKQIHISERVNTGVAKQL